jgi:CPA1 family monovalent cation:H+ antiporter
MIGLEVIAIDMDWRYLVIGSAAILLALAARTISVLLPVAVFGRRDPLSPGSVPILVWGGLRGGISVALALSLPHGAVSESILTVTYVVVVFSVVVQGSTIRRAVNRFVPGGDGDSIA